MTFNGEEIGDKPTLIQIEIYVGELGLFCEPQDVYDYCEKKEWLTKRGKPIKTLEAAIHVYNSLAVQRYVESNSELKVHKDIENKKERKAAIRKEKEIVLQSRKKRPYSIYRDQIKDQRWKIFRWFILKVRGEQCEICGSQSNLQVHHTHYRTDAKAWEYNCNEVMVVCRDCHQKLHGIK